MIAKYQKEQTVVKLKKAYSAITQTISRAIADYGPISTWELGRVNNCSDIKTFFGKYMTPYLSLLDDIQSCSSAKFNNELYELNGNSIPYNYNQVARFYLSDGVSVTGYITNNDVNVKKIQIYIDINGDKKPNKMGKDVFEFCYYLNHSSNPLVSGKFSPPTTQVRTREYLKNGDAYSCSKNKTGARCSTLIMLDGWKISDDYPW